MSQNHDPPNRIDEQPSFFLAQIGGKAGEPGGLTVWESGNEEGWIWTDSPVTNWQ